VDDDQPLERSQVLLAEDDSSGPAGEEGGDPGDELGILWNLWHHFECAWGRLSALRMCVRCAYRLVATRRKSPRFVATTMSPDRARLQSIAASCASTLGTLPTVILALQLKSDPSIRVVANAEGEERRGVGRLAAARPAPEELHVEVSRRGRLDAYWNGCAWVT